MTTMYEFPMTVSGSNLVQTKNGSVLTTTQGSPSIYRIEGLKGTQIATFPGHENTFGIVEVESDVFYVNAANYTHAPQWSGVRGSNTIYRLNLTDDEAGPIISKVVTVHQALTLDGMALLSQESGQLVMADTQSGELYLVDTQRNTYEVVFQSELLNMTAATGAELDHVGVNGLEIEHSTLFYTNTARQSFGRVPLSVNGIPNAAIEVLLPKLRLPDDFAIEGSKVLLTELGHGLFLYDLNRPASVQQDPPLVANLLGANAVKFGRADTVERCTLYALYNRKILNQTGSGLVSADLRNTGLRRGC